MSLILLDNTNYIEKAFNNKMQQKDLEDDFSFLDKTKTKRFFQTNNSFKENNKSKALIQNTQEVVNFFNQKYPLQVAEPVKLQLLKQVLPQGIKNKSSTILEDEGAIFNATLENGGAIQISANHLQSGRSEILSGLEKKYDFKTMMAFVLFHEIGHAIDYTGKMTSIYFNDNGRLKKLETGSILFSPHQSEDQDYSRLIETWRENNLFVLGNKLLPIEEAHAFLNVQQNFKENIADSWSCLLTHQFLNHQKANIPFNTIAQDVLMMRQKAFPALNSTYAVSNALNKLQTNFNPNKQYDFQNLTALVQKTAEEGLILNLKDIFGSNAKEIQQYKDNFFKTVLKRDLYFNEGESSLTDHQFTTKLLDLKNRFIQDTHHRSLKL